MLRPAVVSLLLSAVATAQAPAAQNQGPGYTDTPVLPNGWRVHDAARPRPRVVDPGPAPSQPVPAPADAVVLFDGRNLDAFTGRDGKAQWALVEGAMESNRTGDLETKAHFGDCQVHLEWATPAVVKGESQGRGNSGVFFFGRYEVQVLDSYDNPTYADGQAAALYGQTPPLVNACRKPGEWQTYDLVFRAPRFAADGALREPARVTVVHNGILVHHDQPMFGATAHRALPSYRAHAAKGPIKLQDHGDPVRFRNFWVRELDLDRSADAAPAPASQPAETPGK
ncbi:MAG: DUF1080 domain-containing protein [Planctomycetes bacterium]|nr:DUF1080 domain-containing protein [Planctomycetota bacterium]